MQQALRDLSQWVEKGVLPPQSTNYKVVDGQVVVSLSATDRKGIQPVVDLTIKGKKRADVRAGHKVVFSADIQVPQDAGKIVKVEWDFEGEGTVTRKGSFKAMKNNYYKASTATDLKIQEPISQQ